MSALVFHLMEEGRGGCEVADHFALRNAAIALELRHPRVSTVLRAWDFTCHTEFWAQRMRDNFCYLNKGRFHLRFYIFASWTKENFIRGQKMLLSIRQRSELAKATDSCLYHVGSASTSASFPHSTMFLWMGWSWHCYPLPPSIPLPPFPLLPSLPAFLPSLPWLFSELPLLGNSPDPPPQPSPPPPPDLLLF